MVLLLDFFNAVLLLLLEYKNINSIDCNSNEYAIRNKNLRSRLFILIILLFDLWITQLSSIIAVSFILNLWSFVIQSEILSIKFPNVFQLFVFNIFDACQCPWDEIVQIS